MPGTDYGTAPDPAAQWLLAVYDATMPEDFEVYDDGYGDYTRPYHMQPMFQLKEDTEPCPAMCVTASDYRDPGRRWL